MAATNTLRAGSLPPPRPSTAPRRILCTIDFSEASSSAVAEAVALARAYAAEITVLFVIPYASSPAGLAAVPEGVSSAVAEDVEALLEPARSGGMTVRVCLRAGRPAEEIMEAVRRTAPDMIVMGTHGRGGFKRWALGSVAAEVLRSAGCPVVTIAHHRPEPAPPLPERRNVVACAVGLSPSSPKTIARAAEVADRMGAHLMLLHVVPDHAPAGMTEASARLHAAATIAAAHGVPAERIEEVVVSGVPARQILRLARARGARLVVVGGDGLGRHPLLDSTPDQVIRRAHCAVLTVRTHSEVA